MVIEVTTMLKTEQTFRYNNREEFDPSILKKLLLDDSEHELTDNHAVADGTLAQLINMKQ